MILVKPSFKIETPAEFFSGMLVRIEKIGRVCYKSEDKITSTSANEFIKKIIANGHEAVIEHEYITVRFICDRGISHELVRHRLCNFAQESTRYCDYNKSHCTFIIPPWVTSVGAGVYPGLMEGLCATFDESPDIDWVRDMVNAESSYQRLRKKGWSPQQARSVLPNSLKTELIMTANLREWRHILKLRAVKGAHPQLIELMIPLQEELHKLLPLVF